ncbi:MAG: hypothetical protein IPN77_19305 [Sandaracinaceae bacterium]|nr:hypothetical protein [Sandaracinaceae bacterium]
MALEIAAAGRRPERHETKEWLVRGEEPLDPCGVESLVVELDQAEEPTVLELGQWGFPEPTRTSAGEFPPGMRVQEPCEFRFGQGLEIGRWRRAHASNDACGRAGLDEHA